MSEILNAPARQVSLMHKSSPVLGFVSLVSILFCCLGLAALLVEWVEYKRDMNAALSHAQSQESEEFSEYLDQNYEFATAKEITSSIPIDFDKEHYDACMKKPSVIMKLMAHAVAGESSFSETGSKVSKWWPLTFEHIALQNHPGPEYRNDFIFSKGPDAVNYKLQQVVVHIWKYETQRDAAMKYVQFIDSLCIP
jgi:hypothetical protein